MRLVWVPRWMECKETWETYQPCIEVASCSFILSFGSNCLSSSFHNNNGNLHGQHSGLYLLQVKWSVVVLLFLFTPKLLSCSLSPTPRTQKCSLSQHIEGRRHENKDSNCAARRFCYFSRNSRGRDGWLGPPSCWGTRSTDLKLSYTNTHFPPSIFRRNFVPSPITSHQFQLGELTLSPTQRSSTRATVQKLLAL